jgi:hypothetical protein
LELREKRGLDIIGHQRLNDIDCGLQLRLHNFVRHALERTETVLGLQIHRADPIARRRIVARDQVL